MLLRRQEREERKKWEKAGESAEAGGPYEGGGDSGKGGETVVSEKVFQGSCWFNCGVDLWGLTADCKLVIHRKFCAGYDSAKTEVPVLSSQIMLKLQLSIMESVCMTKRSSVTASKMTRSLELDQSKFCDDPEVSFKLATHLLGPFWFYC
jgi:hypothetical protein